MRTVTLPASPLRGQQFENHDLFFERFEHRAQRAAEVGGVAGQVGGAAHQQPFLTMLEQRLQQDGRRPADRVPEFDRGRSAVAELGSQVCDGDRGRRELLAVQGLAEQLAQLGLLLFVQRVAEFDNALVDPARIGDHHQQQPHRREHHHLEVAHRRRRQKSVLHDGHLPGQLGQQPDRAAQHVVEADAGVQEAQDGPPFRRRHRFDAVEAVDELAVALLGGDAARAGVRLGDGPPPRAPPCRCGRWRWTRQGCVVPPGSWNRSAPGWPRSRRRSHATPQSDDRRRCPRGHLPG